MRQKLMMLTYFFAFLISNKIDSFHTTTHTVRRGPRFSSFKAIEIYYELNDDNYTQQLENG